MCQDIHVRICMSGYTCVRIHRCQDIHVSDMHVSGYTCVRICMCEDIHVSEYTCQDMHAPLCLVPNVN